MLLDSVLPVLPVRVGRNENISDIFPGHPLMERPGRGELSHAWAAPRCPEVHIDHFPPITLQEFLQAGFFAVHALERQDGLQGSDRNVVFPDLLDHRRITRNLRVFICIPRLEFLRIMHITSFIGQYYINQMFQHPFPGQGAICGVTRNCIESFLRVPNEDIYIIVMQDFIII